MANKIRSTNEMIKWFEENGEQKSLYVDKVIRNDFLLSERQGMIGSQEIQFQPVGDGVYRAIIMGNSRHPR